MENYIIFAVFLVSAFYLIRLVYNQFWGKKVGCAKGCGGACSNMTDSTDLLKQK
ncbi:FeoB-associated Cys-rich membrane protein [Sandaracinomonas limnophila]|uniref:FeoB-associated Cys-rich membrane protein n=1 Tax=Sandaracinomonas limnophila TaxID=1862386 RepID=UPI0013E313BA|nr:FeoB-associated Cys-rich membrane protein [Sandaracinomonas limnophila]